LSTSYGITAATEAETTELLKIIAQYYLKPESPAEEDVAEWEASTSYNADAIVRPTVPNGHVYIASVDVEAGHGSSGTTEPTWPTDDDDTVTDNEVVWTENGAPPEDAEDEIDLS
jgi:hypothetical protein